jgi:TPR repeat protein
MAKKNTRWQKGQSGNPATQFKPGNQASKGHGRPRKLPKLEDLLAEVLGEEIHNDMTAAEVVLKALRAKAVRGDVNAAQLLLERAYGKPKQFIEQVNKNQVDLSTLSEEELTLVLLLQEKIKPTTEGEQS